MDLLILKDWLKRQGIALTGGIATGKSTVGRLLRERGELVIDADELSRAVTAPGSAGLARIVEAFGAGVLTEAGALDRRRLGALVFAEPEARRRLEAITHPLIRQALGERLAAAFAGSGPRRFFYEASLIFETGTQHDFRQVWVTFCPAETQVERLMRRDGRDREQALAILASQLPAADKAAAADLVIRTEGTLAEVEAQVTRALASIA